MFKIRVTTHLPELTVARWYAEDETGEIAPFPLAEGDVLIVEEELDEDTFLLAGRHSPVVELPPGEWEEVAAVEAPTGFEGGPSRRPRPSTPRPGRRRPGRGPGRRRW